MSANNYLLIRQKGKVFTVSDNDYEIDSGILVGKASTLKGAITLADDYQTQNVVEYGIQFDLEDK